MNRFKPKLLSLPLILILLTITLFIGGSIVVANIFLGSSAAGAINLQKGLVGHWDLNGNAEDRTPNSNDGAVTGAALTTDRNSQSNKAYSFNGTSDYINAGSGSSLRITSNITLSAWINPTVVNAVQAVIWRDAAYGLLVSDTAQVSGMIDVANTEYTATSTSTISAGTWAHVAITYDGANILIYINGSLASTPLARTGAIYNPSTSVWIGSEEFTARWFKGSIDDVRIYNRALSAAEVTALYNSYDPGVAVSTLQKGLVGHWDLNGNAEDRTPNSNDGTVTEATLTTDRKSQTSKAYSFNGTTDYISVSDNDGVDLSSGKSISISAWIRADASKQQRIVAKYVAGQGGYSLLVTSSNTLRVVTNDGLGITKQAISSETITIGQWYHAVGVIAANGLLQLYLNGSETSYSTQETYTSDDLSNNDTLKIGTREDLVTDFFSGLIDDVRIYNRALSAAEVTALYNSYDPGIAVSTLQKGLVGHWDLNGNAEDRTPNSNDGTVTAATLTTDRKSQSDKAYHFDGSDDYITLSSSILPTAAITVATWVQLDSHKNWSHFVVNRWTSEGDWLLFENATSWEWGIRSPGTTQQVVVSAHNSTAAWTFLVGTYDGTTQRLYVNGVEAGTPITHTVTLSQAGLKISNATGNSPDGKMDDVRIYNRALSATEVLALYGSYR